MKQCSIEGCEKVARKRGWCRTHYSRWQRHGSPLTQGNRPYRQTWDEFIEHVQNQIADPDENGCRLWTGGTAEGYGIAGWTYKGRLHQFRVHRLLLEERLGRPLHPGMHACHDCQEKRCVEHVREDTRSANMIDMHRDGTMKTILTSDQVLEYRRRHSEGESIASIAGGYKSPHYAAIRAATLGERWKWLT